MKAHRGDRLPEGDRRRRPREINERLAAHRHEKIGQMLTAASGLCTTRYVLNRLIGPAEGIDRKWYEQMNGKPVDYDTVYRDLLFLRKHGAVKSVEVHDGQLDSANTTVFCVWHV